MTTTLAKRDRVIAQLERARNALPMAGTVREVKQIADAMAAAKVYARRQQLGEDVIGRAHALQIDALTRLGQLLTPLPRASGGQPYQRDATRSNLEQVDTPTWATVLNMASPAARKLAMIAQQLAELPPDMRAAIALRELSLTEARRQQQHAARPSIRLPSDQYRVLYADPPWQYRDTRAGLGDGQRVNRAETAAAQDYPTMTVDELQALDIATLRAPDAVLFCWATCPLLPDALSVVAAWGFTYKTLFVWHKPAGSFGHYHRADVELLLVATHGRATPDAEMRVSQVFTAPRTGHSVKPEAARILIDTLYPYGPRLELFARRPPPGAWHAWGNEPGPA